MVDDISRRSVIGAIGALGASTLAGCGSESPVVSAECSSTLEMPTDSPEWALNVDGEVIQHRSVAYDYNATLVVKALVGDRVVQSTTKNVTTVTGSEDFGVSFVLDSESVQGEPVSAECSVQEYQKVGMS